MERRLQTQIPEYLATVGVEYGLSPTTLQILVNNGFTTERALRRVQVADLEIMNIAPLGQRRLVEAVMEDLRQGGTSVAPQPEMAVNGNTQQMGVAGVMYRM